MQFLVVAAGLVALAPPALAQQDRIVRLGILVSGTIEQRGDLDRALTEGLRAKGYVEGKNLLIERRYGGSMEQGMTVPAMPEKSMNDALSRNAKDLAGMKLDAIITSCAPSTLAAKQATSSIPIVMASVSDPVAQGFIASLAKPGRNITGLSSQADELLPKRLELLASVVPSNTLVAVLANSRNAVHPPMWQKLKSAAPKLKLRLLSVNTDDGAGLSAAFEAVIRARAKALLVLPDDPMIFNVRAEVTALATKYRIPDFYWASEFADAGGLMSYGANLRASYIDAASYVEKVVKGANPATLPVSQPTRFELVVNMKTAKALGLTFPQSFLVRVDRVIE